MRNFYYDIKNCQRMLAVFLYIFESKRRAIRARLSYIIYFFSVRLCISEHSAEFYHMGLITR